MMNKNQSIIYAFIDDYTTWIIGDSVKFNFAKLQSQIIHLLKR